MRWELRFLVLAMLVPATFSAAQAQSAPVMTEAQFRQIIEPGFSAPCAWIPLGKHQLKPMETERDRRVLIVITAMAKAGVVRVTDLRKKLSEEPFSWDKLMKIGENPFGAELEVHLKDGLDQSHIDKTRQCLKAPPIMIDRIVKIDPVKGGTILKWDGAVVYITWKRDLSSASSLFLAYSNSLPAYARMGEHAKSRYLLRYDPFTERWRVLASDSAPIHEGEFRSNEVVQAIQRD